MTHLALTDTNALYGVLAFNRACQEAGLQAIIGMTVTVAAEAWPNVAKKNNACQLVLLATGPAGYRSLCRLSSLVQGSPDWEQRAVRGLDWAALAEHRQGLICLSGGRRGWLERLLRAGDEAAGREYARRLAGIYGENAWLSLELHTAADEAMAREMAGIGQELGLPCAAVQPVYCLTRQDQARLRLQRELAAINPQGYAALFLVVADIVAFARGEGVPVSTCGSVTNSPVAFCTGITSVDPMPTTSCSNGF